MKVLFLCGGTGKRMFPLTEDKFLLKFLGIDSKLVDTGHTKFGAVIGDKCRTGVNVSITPGVKIAPGTQIAPGTVVMRDIGPPTTKRKV